MRILAISFGTEGDTRPIVALCRGLMAAGHETRLLVESSGVNLASTSGVPAVALAGGPFETSAANRRIDVMFGF